MRHRELAKSELPIVTRKVNVNSLVVDSGGRKGGELRAEYVQVKGGGRLGVRRPLNDA